MKAESTVRKQLRAINQGRDLLDPYDLASAQAYGAAEALRWVLGEESAPAPVGLTVPLNDICSGGYGYRAWREGGSDGE